MSLMYHHRLFDTDSMSAPPWGSLYSLEEEPEQGPTSIGLTSESFVILASVSQANSGSKKGKKKNKANSELSSHPKKIFKVDDYIGMAIANRTGDGRVLSRYMCTKCINHSFTHKSPLPVANLVYDLSDAQVCHQQSWKRPFADGLLVGGLGKSIARLYYIGPFGNYFFCEAFAIGSRLRAAKRYMDKNLESFNSSSREDLLKHGLLMLRETLHRGKLTSSICTIAVLGDLESHSIYWTRKPCNH